MFQVYVLENSHFGHINAPILFIFIGCHDIIIIIINFFNIESEKLFVIIVNYYNYFHYFHLYNLQIYNKNNIY